MLEPLRTMKCFGLDDASAIEHKYETVVSCKDLYTVGVGLVDLQWHVFYFFFPRRKKKTGKTWPALTKRSLETRIKI